eukprot:1094081-Pleurochrysis_carterae.AAC.1
MRLAEQADELAEPGAQEDKLVEIGTDTEPEDSSTFEDESDSENSTDSHTSDSLSDSDALITPPAKSCS